MTNSSIILKKGSEPGKTLAIFAGVHGNELVGVDALKNVSKTLRIQRGRLYLVYANPPAIKNNKRFIEKNLNRLFYRKTGKKVTYEEKRAVELMDILDQCDALLDIHAYNSRSGGQFAIGERNTIEIVKRMNFPFVVSGFSRMGKGTDGYMYRNKKPGLCIECGTVNQTKKFVPLAERSIYQFLQYFGVIDKKVPNSRIVQKHFKARRVLYKKSSSFKFVKNFKDFELLPAGKVFAVDGKKLLRAKKNEYIIFPRPSVPIGGEVCIILNKTKSKND